MFRIGSVILLAFLLVSCASGTPQSTTPTAQPAETVAATVEPGPTMPPAPSPTAPSEPGAPPVADLQGRTWYLETYLDAQGNPAPVLPGTQVTVEFRADGKVGGSAGCNTYSGTYQVDGDKLKIGPLASTMMACLDPAGLMDQETAYLQALGNAATFRSANGKLELLEPAGQVILTYTEMPAEAQPPASSVEVPASLSQQGLENAVYRIDTTASGTVQLTDGVYTEPAAPGSESMTRVELSDWIAYGALPDGQTAAAVILVSSGGGSGTFYHLALMTDASGQAVNNATTFLGDRIEIHSLAFEDGKIVVELTRQGPEDPMCCPTQRMLEVYVYQDGALVKESSVNVAQPSLTGVVWRWAEFQSSDESVVKPDDPASYTLEFLPDGKLSVRADCNQASGTYTVDGSQLTLQVQATTRVACPPGSLAEKYVEYLNSVVSNVFRDGNLYLALKFDSGIMEFIP